jgi:hypothetical protein
MKTIHSLFAVLLLSTALALQPCAAAGKGDSADDLVALEHFLRLSDEQLDQLQAALARIRAMTPEERAAFAEEVLCYRALPGDQRRQIREGWGRQNRDNQDQWREMMQQLGPQQRDRIQSELQSLPPDKRTQRRLELLEQWRKRPAKP